MSELPLSHVRAVCVSHYGPQPETSAFLRELDLLGAHVQVREGQPDIARARSEAITAATRADVGAVLLLVDDDVTAHPDNVVRLCQWPREGSPRLSAPARSGVYVTGAGGLAASPYKRGLYLVGLGLCAVQLSHLREIEPKVPECRADKFSEPFRAWSTAGPGPNGYWLADDYSFSLMIGGVHLDATVPVGHIKKQILMPGRDSLATILERDLECIS